jgi:hypothetical protein
MKSASTSKPDRVPAENPLRTAWRAWDRFWFSPSPPTTLALMRIFAGLIALYVLFGYALDLQGFVGEYAWIGKDVTDFQRNKMDVEAPPNNWDGPVEKVGHGMFVWSLYFHVTDPGWMWTIHLSVMLVTLLFTVGFATRLTSVLTWLGAIMYINRASSSLFGMDTMTNLGLLYLMIAPCGATLSVDRWLEVRRLRQHFGPAYQPPPPPALSSATLATRLVQVNFCIIYLMSGFSKLLGSSWWNGTAPTLVLLNYSFAPFNVGLYAKTITFLASHRWLWEIIMTSGVIGTLAIEVGLPFLIWNPRLRWFMVCCSALLHTMIGLTMGLVTFSLMMLVLLLAFVPPEVSEQVVAGLRQKLRSWIRPSPAVQGPHMKPTGSLVASSK